MQVFSYRFKYCFTSTIAKAYFLMRNCVYYGCKETKPTEVLWSFAGEKANTQNFPLSRQRYSLVFDRQSYLLSSNYTKEVRSWLI